MLAVPGVMITAAITGAAAAWILNIPWLEGFLLGSIVGSTDAAAVFAVLRFGGIHLARDGWFRLWRSKAARTIPMAIFLTVGLIEVLTGEMTIGPEFLLLFVAADGSRHAGWAHRSGYAAVYLINRINLDAAGLYPILVSAFGMLAFGFACRASTAAASWPCT